MTSRTASCLYSNVYRRRVNFFISITSARLQQLARRDVFRGQGQLDSDQSSKPTFTLTPDQLSFVDAAGHRTISAGTYRLFVGGGQPAPDQLANPATGSIFHITGEKSLAY